MSIRQIMRQLEYKARALQWSQAPSNKVFGEEAAVSSVLTWDHLIDHMRFPFLVFTFQSSSSHGTNPSLKTSQIKAAIVCKHENDRLGRSAGIGGGQSYNYGSSEGKGIWQLQEKFFSSFAAIYRPDGIIYGLRITSENLTGGSGVEDAISLAILEMELQLEVWETSTYVNAFNLQATQNGADVDLTWEDPPDRYDLIQTNGLIIRRKLNSNPTSVTDGTAVTTASIGDLAYTDIAPGAGAWHYALFVSYDESSETPATADNYSSGIFKIITVV